MKVYLNKITGIDEAILSMYLSKRSWTIEIDNSVRKLCNENLDENGFLVDVPSKEFLKLLDKVIKYGVDFGHTTLLRYIDFSFMVDGLHRAGQDDWDSHARRMDNRIVRASTRLGTFENGEKSDYYKKKILYPFEAFDILNIELPKTIQHEDKIYVKTDFGYILEEYVDDQDVKRGLYPMAIPSTFLFKVQYPEFGHIYQHRNFSSNANPEVMQLAEECFKEIHFAFPMLAENLDKIKMQK